MNLENIKAAKEKEMGTDIPAVHFLLERGDHCLKDNTRDFIGYFQTVSPNQEKKNLNPIQIAFLEICFSLTTLIVFFLVYVIFSRHVYKT